MLTAESTFSAKLRQATRQDHTDAESSEFISSLMQGERSAADYVLLLAQYRPLYAALEGAVTARREDARVKDLFDPALDRLAAIDADLEHLVAWAGLNEAPAVVPETLAYAARIAEIASEEDPARLVAHHYLRYLGDLSGGQVIGTLVGRHYGIPAEGLNMYNFPAIPKPKVYKDEYRELLDVFAGVADEDALVDEAALGFRLNREVFAALGRISPKVTAA